MEIIRKTIENDEEYLRQISAPVDLNDKSYKEEIKALEEFCLKTECFALAAVQIGIPKRMIYLKNTTLDMDKYKDPTYNESKVLINPEIISKEGLTTFWEACASCSWYEGEVKKWYNGKVKRPYKIRVRYFDIEGNEHEDEFEGFESTVLCHEIDHLDGILHIDIADKVITGTTEERVELRKKEGYTIISKTGDFELLKNKEDL